MPISNVSGNKIIDHMNGKTSWTMPTTYLGLYTTLPTDPSNAGTEMSGGSYARTLINASWGAAASRAASSNANIQVTCAVGTVVGVGMFDASSAGNLIFYEALLQTTSAEAQTLANSGAGIEVCKTTNLGAGGIKNVVVKDSSDTTTYVENTDYWAQYDSGRIIRITSGAIASGATIHITYDWATSRAVLDADIIQINSGNLKNAFKAWK